MATPKRKPSKAPPWAQGSDADGTSFGGWLRQQREVREISLREIAEASKISLRYLEAFEQDRYDLLPSPVFAKGFLRQYALYVGLDVDEVMNHYLWATQGGEVDDDEEKEETVVAGGIPWIPLLIAAVLIAAVVVLLLFFRDRGTSDEAAQEGFLPPPAARDVVAEVPENGGGEVAAPVVGAPSGAAEPSGLPAVAESDAPLRVALEFSGSCWVDAVVDRRRRVSKTYSQGEFELLEAEESVLFRTLGNSGGVKIEVNGRLLDIGGTEDVVKKNILVDLAVAERLGGSPGLEGAG